MLHEGSEPLFCCGDLPWDDYEIGPDRNAEPVSKGIPDFLVVSQGLGGRIYVSSALAAQSDVHIIGPEYFTLEWSRRDFSWYADHFKEGRGKNQRMITGDASESLVFLPSLAIQAIKAFAPDLRIVFILQDPMTFCREYLEHQHFYGKGVFAGRDLYLEDIPDSMILECLIRDDLLSRIDYESLIKRWAAFFPPSQLSIHYLENATLSPDDLFKEMFDFLNVKTPDGERTYPCWKPFEGKDLEHKSGLISACVSDIKQSRMMSFFRFLVEKGLPIPPWPMDGQGDDLPSVYIDTRKNWRITFHEGLFQAVHVITGQTLTSSFLSDILKSVSPDRKQDGSLSSEDSRLGHILSETSRQRQQDRQRTDRLNKLTFAEGYQLYNILKSGERYIALRQALGPVGVFREKLGEREIAPHILRAETMEAVKRKIDLANGEKRAGNYKNGIVEHWI